MVMQQADIRACFRINKKQKNSLVPEMEEKNV